MVQLSCSDIQLNFGGVRALSGVSFDVKKGEIFAIIGPNGAGKSSMLNCISGVYRPQKGRVVFEETDITPLPPYQRSKMGIARSFQNIALFKGMTVIDNLMIGRHLHQHAGLVQGLAGVATDILAHRRFGSCGVGQPRKSGHLLLLWGFLGALLTIRP